MITYEYNQITESRKVLSRINIKIEVESVQALDQALKELDQKGILKNDEAN